MRYEAIICEAVNKNLTSRTLKKSDSFVDVLRAVNVCGERLEANGYEAATDPNGPSDAEIYPYQTCYQSDKLTDLLVVVYIRNNEAQFEKTGLVIS